MRALVAPDSFKGTLRATEAAVAITNGLLAADPSLEITCLPLADGGEGTLDALLAATGGTSHAIRTHDAFFEVFSEHIGLLADGVICIESALFCGLGGRSTDMLDPLGTSSFGLGEAILASLDHRPKRLLIGLGGTITVDGGLGMLLALGARCLDDAGTPIHDFGGRGLLRLASIDIEPARTALANVDVHVLCDVDCRLLGENGARLFMRQKGADRATEQCLHDALMRFSGLLAHPDLPGSGAAGGIGYALAAIGGKLQPGAATVLAAAGAERHIDNCDAIVTGEGKLDRQTRHGKLISALLLLAKNAGKPVHAICGTNELSKAEQTAMGLASVTVCGEGPQPPFIRLRNAAQLLELG